MSFKKVLACLVMVVLVQSALTATVTEKARDELSAELAKLISNPRNSTLTRTTVVYQTIVNIQAVVNSILTYVNSLVTSSNISNVVAVLQTEIVNPLLTLLNNLASFTFVQSVQAVYAVVLVLQTVLTIANFALTRATSVLNGTLAGTITTVQVIVDSVFSVILGIVQAIPI